MDYSFSELNLNSVETLPGYEARAAFTVNSATIFREEVDIVPTIVDEHLSYIPWGGDNLMPFKIIEHIEKDDTLATCQMFNAEVCYGAGLRYDTCIATAQVRNEVEDFLLDNDLAAYFLGVSQDLKHYGFAVSVLILTEDGTKIVRLLRKEACYCRFAPADAEGKIPSVLYANWRKCVSSRADIEVIDLLDPSAPWRDLQDKLAKKLVAGSSPSCRESRRWTPLITPYLTTLHSLRVSGTISSSSSELPKKRSSAILRLSSITSRSVQNTGRVFFVPRALPTAASNRSASCARSNRYSTS